MSCIPEWHLLNLGSKHPVVSTHNARFEAFTNPISFQCRWEMNRRGKNGFTCPKDFIENLSEEDRRTLEDRKLGRRSD